MYPMGPELGVRTWEPARLASSLSLPFISCVALGKLLYLSESCSLQLENGD